MEQIKILKNTTRMLQMQFRIHKETRNFSNLKELELIDRSLLLCKKILLELNEEAPNMRSVFRWFASLERCAAVRYAQN